ncbi:MAG: hypothetical protein Q8R00_02830 [Candidatus Nanoarchaeia archaeon]|nr:hypothetical protein [Candidatus Nanoarchaeia archaeon]
MFRRYGIVGLLMILFAEVNFLLKIEPFATWYFPIVWFGYILVIDALVYMLRSDSYLMNRKKTLFWMFIASAVFWWVFEFINSGGVSNWTYGSDSGVTSGINQLLPTAFIQFIYKAIAFSTVLPAFLETYELIMAVHLFDKFKLRRKHDVGKPLILGMLIFGLFCLIGPLVWPKYLFPLVWMSFFFLLDPINYLHKQPSIIGHLKDRKLKIPLTLMLAGLICGFFWEFWNYWAKIKWYYDIPIVGFFKIFEMPILGYGGYLPFALELYAMWYFVVYLYNREVKHLKLH